MDGWMDGQFNKVSNVGSDETPHRTTLDPKILGDGIDQTPQRTGDPDTLSQRGYGPTTTS